MPAIESLASLTPLAGPATVLLITLAIAFVVRRLILSRLQNWTRRTDSRLDDSMVAVFRTPSLLWVLILAIHLALQSSPLPPRITSASARVLLVLWIVSATLAFAQLAGALVHHYAASVAGTHKVTSLTDNLARLLVFLMGGLVLLNALGVSITPILTALGVGGLAVALALQDTLANLFAGFYITVAGQIRVGDYVKLDTGQEGYVTDITWRATTIRALANNLIIVPNAKLAQAIVINHHLPEPRMSLLINIGVAYETDPDHVERVLVEEAKAGAGEISGLLGNPPPFVRFIPGFGAYSLDFTLICQVAEFTDQYLVQHELRKRIFRRFREEGIQIPFPVQTLQIERSPEGSPAR